MSFFDDMTGAIDRGVSAAGKSTKAAQIRMQLSSLARQRRELTAHLGASLYEATKQDESLRAGREGMYDAIERLDREYADLDEQVRMLEGYAATPAPLSFCDNCGAAAAASDAFCTKCGTPLAGAVTSKG